MKHIIFVKNMKEEADVNKISAALSETRVDYKINLEDHAVIVDGGNDIVYTAKTIIRECGFTIE